MSTLAGYSEGIGKLPPIFIIFVEDCKVSRFQVIACFLLNVSCFHLFIRLYRVGQVCTI